MNTQEQISSVKEFDRVIKCLFLELHSSIWDDVNDKWNKVKETLPTDAVKNISQQGEQC